jgi:hypothetical protein
MTDLDKLLGDYIEAYLGGKRPDPATFLEGLEGDEREQLSGLIEAFLLDAPNEEWDAEGYRESIAKQVVESLDQSLHGQSGLWPAVLPRLRNRAKLKRAEVVERLAAGIGAAGREEKVAAYYHQMERGQLPAGGVSGRVLEVLGEIVGESAARLRELGETLVPGGGGSVVETEMADAAFARTAAPDPAHMPAPAESPGDEAAVRARRAGADRDEIDDLFTGG